MGFSEKVWEKCKKVPKGKVTTYKALAHASGDPKAYRAVGNALNKNRSKSVPCHRVVCSNGFAGGYAKGTKKKIKVLRSEGIEVSKEGFVDLKSVLFKF